MEEKGKRRERRNMDEEEKKQYKEEMEKKGKWNKIKGGKRGVLRR